MTSTNFTRMIQLATDAFAVHNDPRQLNVNEEVIEKLHKLHPATLSEYIEGDGPVIWVLLIPTTQILMQRFIDKEITETELLDETPIGSAYDSLYLCSALTLEEYRNKGLTKKLALQSIQEIRKTHPIKYLFVWNFSKEGADLANRLAENTGLKLLERAAESKG